MKGSCDADYICSGNLHTAASKLIQAVKMNRISLTKAAKLSGVTRDKARYWTKLLGLEITKENRTLFIPAGGENLLEAMKNSIQSGISPSKATQEILENQSLPVIHEETNNKSLDDMEKAIMLLVESNKRLADENKDLNIKFEILQKQNKAILETVSKQAKAINKLLPAEKPEVTFKPWEPPKRTVSKVPYLKRLFLEIFNPIALRENFS